MRKSKYYDAIKDLLSKGGELKVDDFAKVMKGSPMPTVYNMIRSLIERKVIFPTKRGKYSIGYRMEYHPKMSEKLIAINKLLTENLVNQQVVLSERDGNIFVEVSKNAVDKSIDILKQEYSKIIRLKEYYQLPDGIDELIVVGNVLTDSPLLKTDNVIIPSIEKILVDMLAAQRRQPMETDGIAFEFQKAFEVYKPDESKLLRYAGRRGLKEEVESLLKNINQERISMISQIQQFFINQPIENAWVFGSFSRGEERSDSDIDIMVDFIEGKNISLISHANIINTLSDLISKPVDIVTRKGIATFASPSVNHDKYKIYERIG